MKSISNLYEDIGKTGNNNIGFGVKDDFKVNKNSNNIVNPYTKIVEEDLKVLSEISENLINYINNLTEMYNYLDKFGKINPNPIQTVINTLKSYQEEIAKELKNVK
jgi:hypothetical protein